MRARAASGAASPIASYVVSVVFTIRHDLNSGEVNNSDDNGRRQQLARQASKSPTERLQAALGLGEDAGAQRGGATVALARALGGEIDERCHGYGRGRGVLRVNVVPLRLII